MRGSGMANWRLMQVVLDDDGVHEVEYDFDSVKHLRCTCGKRFNCKHRKFVKAELAKSGNRISLSVPESMTPEDVHDAYQDADSYRQIVLKYGRVGAIA